MGIRVWAIAAAAGAVALGGAVPAASAQELSGRYETLDGRVQHDFQASSVYRAQVFTPERILSFKGLYQQGENVCLAGIQGDATGGTGNLLLYVGDNECCLEFRRIADKFAVTKKGMTGDKLGPGLFLCRHHFVKYIGRGGAAPPAASSSSPSAPRQLQPKR